MTYSSANDQLQGRNRQSRKIANNTYLERRGEDIAVRLHSTDVVLLKSNNDVVLDSGSWLTVTTKQRMNNFLWRKGCSLWSNRGVWYISVDGKEYPFADGITIHADHSVSGVGEDLKGLSKLKRQISKYCKDYMAAMADGQVLAPSAGDCWFCMLRTSKIESGQLDAQGKYTRFEPKKGQTLGEAFKDRDHIKSHIEEKYYVPSLLARAIERFPISQAARWYLGSWWDSSVDEGTRNSARRAGKMCADQLEKALRRYINEQLGMQG